MLILRFAAFSATNSGTVTREGPFAIGAAGLYQVKWRRLHCDCRSSGLQRRKTAIERSGRDLQMLKTAKQKSKQREMRLERDSVGLLPAKERADRPRFAWATLLLGLVGAILLWAAFPPLNLPWLWLVRWPRLPGWRPYVVLWLAGFAHWLLMLEGIRLAHPALYAGWIALAAYLGVYLPAFVGLTRVAVHGLKASVVIAAPVVWVGLELLRGYLITGFSMGLLAHTQAEFPRLIQVSDLAG